MNYSRKVQEYILLIFVLGILFGYLDSRSTEISYLIGSGIGVLILSMVISYIIHWVLGKPPSVSNRKEHSKDQILDDGLATTSEKEEKEKMHWRLRPFRHGLYIAAFFFLLNSWSELVNIGVRLTRYF